MPKTKQQPPMPVRLPPDLKRWLGSMAETNLRSLNAEVIAILAAERDRQEKGAAKR